MRCFPQNLSSAQQFNVQNIYFFAQFHVQISLLHNFMNIYINIQYLCKVFVQSQFVYV